MAVILNTYTLHNLKKKKKKNEEAHQKSLFNMLFVFFKETTQLTLNTFFIT